MKYQNAKKRKMNKIANFVQHEVKIGKCSQEDIEDFITFIRATVLSYDKYVEAKAEAAHD